MEFHSCETLEIILDNKILSPDLLIEDVWTKLWLPKHVKNYR